MSFNKTISSLNSPYHFFLAPTNVSTLSNWQQLYALAAPSPMQQLHHPILTEHKVTLWLKRDDLLHPNISGNKWRKLKYISQQALAGSARGLLSFGGAYSNHLHALAALGQQLSLPTVGIVRGENSSQFNPTLTDVRQWGMALKFVDRQLYRRRQDADWLAELAERYPGYNIIPEGGSCPLALPGVAELWQELDSPLSSSTFSLPSTLGINHLILPVASGGTLAGLISARPTQWRISAYAVLKGASWLKEEVCRLYPDAAHDYGWQLRLDHHGGGYAKSSAADLEAIRMLAQQLAIPLEPIYSGKALLGLFRDISAGEYPAHSRLLFLHTGGLQGDRQS